MNTAIITATFKLDLGSACWPENMTDEEKLVTIITLGCAITATFGKLTKARCWITALPNDVIQGPRSGTAGMEG